MDAWIVLDSYGVSSSSSSTSSPPATEEHFYPNGKEVSSSVQDHDQPTSTTSNDGKHSTVDFSNKAERDVDGEDFRNFADSLALDQCEGVKKMGEGNYNYEEAPYLKKKLITFHESYPDILNSGVLTKNLINTGSFDLDRFCRGNKQSQKERFDEVFLRPQNMNVLSSGIEWVSQNYFLR